MQDKLNYNVCLRLTDKQASYITEFAAKRKISKSKAIRIIIDLNKRREIKEELENYRSI